MKISLKRLFALFLSALMVLACIPTVFVTASVTLKTGDIIEFGSYPQSEVTKTKLKNTLSRLAGATDTWTSYGYYSGTGDVDGKMTAKNYMKYTDVTYDGEKYRGVYFSTYRPDKTYYKSTTQTTYTKVYSRDYAETVKYTYQQDSGYFVNTVYWFKFEPIEWRVLDPSKGLVMSEAILDSQPYNNCILYSSDDNEYYGSVSKTYYSNNWEKSSLRAWLNNDFLKTAFTSVEQGNIKTVTPSTPSSYSQYDSADTEDKIFLLSLDDAKNTSYGFSSRGSDIAGDVPEIKDESGNVSTRYAQGSSYAKSQGLRVFDNGNSAWLLRTAGIFGSSCGINAYGYTEDGFELFDSLDGNGIRPAFYFKSIDSISDDSSEEKVKITSNYVYAVPGTDVDKIISSANEKSAVYHNGTKIQSGIVLTGMQLETFSNNTSIKRDIVVIGDLDNDGQVTVADARLVLRAAVKLDTLKGLSLLSANVDFVDDVSVADARAVLRVAVKLDDPALWLANIK